MQREWRLYSTMLAVAVKLALKKMYEKALMTAEAASRCGRPCDLPLCTLGLPLDVSNHVADGEPYDLVPPLLIVLSPAMCMTSKTIPNP
jgi:hypothetical protein